MVVNPLTPRSKIVCPTLFGDLLQRSDSNAVVKRNSHRPFLASLRVGIFQNSVITTSSVVTVAELLEYLEDISPRKIL